MAARTGNRSAWDVLVAEMTPLVWHVARGNGLDRHAAEDVARTVWLALFSHLDQIREPKGLVGWLITTTRHESLRSHGRKPPPVPLTDVLDETMPGTQPAEAEVLHAERDRRLWLAFQQLPGRCQELLRLTVLAGRAEYRVVADVMLRPRASIGPSRRRCLKTLRELFSVLSEFGEESWPGSDEELFRQLDALFDMVDAVPDDLAARMAFAVAVEDAVERIGVEDARDVPAASVDQEEATGSDRAGRVPEQHTTRVLDQSLFVYVAGNDYEAAQELAAAITEVLARQGIEAAPDGPPVISSWAQRFTLSVKRFLSRSEVKQRLQKVEHALEVVAVQKPMSEVNAQHADAVNKLLSSAEKCDSFVALVGSMLMVKHTDESGRVNAYAQTLSVAQVRALERNQHLLKSPAALLAHLETLSHEDDIPATRDVHDVNGAIRPSSQLDRRT